MASTANEWHPAESYEASLTLRERAESAAPETATWDPTDWLRRMERFARPAYLAEPPRELTGRS
jgi:hypothetical protein